MCRPTRVPSPPPPGLEADGCWDGPECCDAKVWESGWAKGDARSLSTGSPQALRRASASAGLAAATSAPRAAPDSERSVGAEGEDDEDEDEEEEEEEEEGGDDIDADERGGIEPRYL